MIKNVIVVGFADAFGIAVGFLRGVILARLLGPEQFGLVIILIAVTAALEMFADAGIDKYLIKSRFGYRSDVLRTCHFFRVAGSSAVALSILLLALPLAELFDAPAIALAIALSGGVVFLRGFVHLDYKLQQRENRFGKEATIDLVRWTADLAAAAVIGLLTRSYWAIIAAVYVNVAVQLLMSHASARTAYRFMPRRVLLPLVARFSTPIYINAALLLAAVQGDRLVVAAMFTKQQLAFYSVAGAIGSGLVSLANKMTMTMMLPKFAIHGGPIEARRRQVNRLGTLIVWGSLAFLLASALLLPTIVEFIYGGSYRGLRPLIVACAVVQMIQFEQGWLTTVLLANGKTKLFPVLTILRAAALPVAVLLVSMSFTLIAIPLAVAFGALLSLIASYWAAYPLTLISRGMMLTSALRLLLAGAALPMLL